MSEKLYIVMPAYNEEETIEPVVREWYTVISRRGAGSKLIVADSGSTDRTHEILLKIKEELHQMEILDTADKQHGPKVIALYDYAIKNGADYIFQTDSDGQTNPGEFDGFWDVRHKFAAVFGNRTVREDGRDRAFVEKTACFLLKFFFGIRVSDANAPFRLMRADTVEKYLYYMKPDYNLPNIMLTTYFVYYGEDVLFKNISFKPRRGGRNSVNMTRIIRIGFGALRDFAKFRDAMI